MHLPKGITSYMSEVSDDYKAFITLAELGTERTSEEQTRAFAAALPCDWVVRECSRLIRRLERGDGRGQEQQQSLVREWAPAEHRAAIERMLREDSGRFFLQPEQLFAVIRMAIEHGTGKPTGSLAQRMRDFSALLLSINDRLSDEAPPENADEEVYTAFGLRALGFATSQVLWHLLARSEATWFTVRALLRSSPKHVPVDAEFERLTGVRLSAYLATITAAFAHTNSSEDSEAPVIDPRVFFSKTPDPAGMRHALESLAGSREWFQQEFAKRQVPRYLGGGHAPVPAATALPARQRSAHRRTPSSSTGTPTIAVSTFVRVLTRRPSLRGGRGRDEIAARDARVRCSPLRNPVRRSRALRTRGRSWPE